MEICRFVLMRMQLSQYHSEQIMKYTCTSSCHDGGTRNIDQSFESSFTHCIRRPTITISPCIPVISEDAKYHNKSSTGNVYDLCMNTSPPPPPTHTPMVDHQLPFISFPTSHRSLETHTIMLDD